MKSFNKKLQEQFKAMCESGKLFKTELTGEKVWEIYLSAFTQENNPIFRDPQSTEHNCNHCKNFIRRYGNIVSIDANGELMSMFDVVCDQEYQKSASEMSNAIKASVITNVFFETFEELNSLPYESCKKTNSTFRLGVDRNPKRYTKEESEKFGKVKPEETFIFDHFHLDLPKMFVDSSNKSAASIMSEYRSSKEVFKRAMDEISLDTLILVRDLISQGSLLDGETHLYKIEQIIPLKTQYDNLPNSKRDNWVWNVAHGLSFAKFKNELIGVLCSELSEGVELNKACQSWNKRVDPINYMKTVAPITKNQIADAKKFVEENGYVESFDRRFATMDDIRVSEILHSNIGDRSIKNVSMFDNVKPQSTRHKRSEFEKVEEVSIDKFMSEILPSCTSVEAFLTNNHGGNLVSLTTANNSDSKPIFKWDNNYSWTFNGNLAGKSQIKEAVKTKGGKIDGVLRFSIMWNEEGDDNSDLDAWCLQPDREKIGFDTPFRKDRSVGSVSSCSGQLDLDITSPHGKLAVENIYFKDIDSLKNGVYKFWVNQYAARNSQGFKAEIEFDGEIYSYEYNRLVHGNVEIAEVTFKNGVFTINHILPEVGVSSSEIYGLQTNEFHKVNLVCLSPNHWSNNKVGNKHYFFMLDGSKTPNPIRSFHNENLLPELAAHRKVLEVLGSTNMINTNVAQLSGLGFNATVKEELVVKVSGSFKRVLKIKF